ncbi:hypothetical protein GOP47_0000409 [Adiantum capillus-veneris]|uniref:Fibronectin type-III domain-containing protein n=1 Tax=Adiantum capillus-veneris TaxID=13818 RepID=A0A9D4VCY8_ADICA|nr:hypothetical protein GOP47_0000409 [Adiantum capillus-veneris]
MGTSKQQVSSASGRKADDVCVVGGGDAADVCVVGDVVGGGSGAACVVDHDSMASAKTEILTGTDALRFLYANCGTAEQARFMKSHSWTKLFSKMRNRETTACSSLDDPLPTSSVLAASRKQRKAYRPSRVPPLEEDEPSSPPKKEDPVVPATLVSHDLKKGKKNGTSDSGAINNNNHKTSLTANDRKQSTQQSLSTQQNAAIVCKNLACKAFLPAEASFCRRCSCCLCMEFDDNKDPSLWITCDREEEGCGLSCHVECALQNQVAGVIKKHGSVWLDGSFACKSCGKISSLIGLWRRQLLVAKAARRVDVLCHRLSLSQRLLNGTVKYKEAHALVDNAVKKLEAEVSLMKKGSAKLERCIVKRLSCDQEVQEMIDLALERAESFGDAQSVVLDAHDAAICKRPLCTMQFEDVCSSSIVVVAVDNYASDDTLGYKLWHRKATDASYPATPTCTIQNSSKKALVSDLQSCTSYVFKMAPFSSQGDREECEADCCTEGIDSTLVGHRENDVLPNCVLRADVNANHGAKNVGTNTQHHSSIEFEIGRPEKFGGLVDDLGSTKAQLIAEVDEGKGCFFVKDLGDAQIGHPFAMQRLVMDDFSVGVTPSWELERRREEPFVSRDGVDNSPILSVAKTNAADNGIISSQSWAMQLHCYDEAQKAMVSNGAASESDIRRHGFSHGSCNNSFHIEEFSISVVRWLECQGHLNKEFRMKFLTWHSLRATEHEKRVVSIFINTLRDCPASLAAQLVDSFQEIINSKRQRAAELGYNSRPYQ